MFGSLWGCGYFFLKHLQLSHFLPAISFISAFQPLVWTFS
jgi:hypothetical protein